MTPISQINWRELRACALTARANAYAPYSRYLVGASVLTLQGAIYTGANVENASYPLSICAERNAIAAAVALGVREFAAMYLVTAGSSPTSPCGACRQVLFEFAPDMALRCGIVDSDTPSTQWRVSELLPGAFGPANLATPKP